MRGLWLTQASGREGYGMRGEPAAAETGVMLQQPEARPVFSREVVPGSWDPGSGGLHRLQGGGGVDSDLCLHTGFLVAAAAALAFHACLWDLH